MEDLEQILSEHGVKPTANRLLVLKALAEFDHPVTMAELEDQIDSIDKSGIFRTLMLFKEKHLLHQIDDGCEGVRTEMLMMTATYIFTVRPVTAHSVLKSCPYPRWITLTVSRWRASTTWQRESALNVPAKTTLSIPITTINEPHPATYLLCTMQRSHH